MNLREQLPILTSELGPALWAQKDPRIVVVEDFPVIVPDHDEKCAMAELLDAIEASNKAMPTIGRKAEPPLWRGLWFWMWNKKLESHVLGAPESLKEEGWVWYSHSALAMVAKALIYPESINGNDSAESKLGRYFVRWPAWFAQFVLLVEERVNKPGAHTTHLIYMGWPKFAEASEQNQLCDLALEIDLQLDLNNEANHLNDLRSEYRRKMRNIPWLVQ